MNVDGFSVEFTDAMNAFVFDETDKSVSTYHGVMSMKAVDIIAEFKSRDVFVEIKNINPAAHQEEESESFKELLNALKYKFRDSYLYRHAEGKVDKPISYICLLARFDNAQNLHIQKYLKENLPTGKPSARWTKELAVSCHVLNVKEWNENFKKWPLTPLK